MRNKAFTVTGNIVDVINRRIFPGVLHIAAGRIQGVEEVEHSMGPFILPGLVDAHIHIESSMLIPSEFARLAVIHGTIATVSDPHEIANVLGLAGVRYMISNGSKVPFKFYFGAPSCVPATPFESSGAIFGAEETEELLSMPEVKYLSEMMNFPGVLGEDPMVMKKLDLAKRYGKPVDGHAPGLLGEDAGKYASAGITTDHECFTLEEASGKIEAGMKILIREGSAACNFDELIPLLKTHPDRVMFCSDDRHPDDLISGHINLLVKRALDAGYDFFDVLRACTLNPREHYGLDTGLLRQGDPADFIMVDDPEHFHIIATCIDGMMVAGEGEGFIPPVTEKTPNHFNAMPIVHEDLKVPEQAGRIRVIEALDGMIVTRSLLTEPLAENGYLVSDTKRDILKLVVLNRYNPSKPAVAFIRNFGLKEGALVSTVAHDSHNIIAVGADDESIVNAINLIISIKGGIALVRNDEKLVLPLPVGGILSNADGQEVANIYRQLDKGAKELGCTLTAPFMTLSFMALLVIPELKLSDKGLFDGTTFSFTGLFENF